MAQLINEAKRFQKLAGIIKENQSLNELNDAEQGIVDAILGEGINEGKFNPKEILNKLILAAKKGLLTAAIVSSVLASCNFPPATNEQIKDKLDNYEMVDSTQVSQIKDEETANYEQFIKDLESQEKNNNQDTVLFKLTSEEGFKNDGMDRIYYYPPGKEFEGNEVVVVKNNPDDYTVYLRRPGERIPSSRFFLKNLSAQDAITKTIELKSLASNTL